VLALVEFWAVVVEARMEVRVETAWHMAVINLFLVCVDRDADFL
jgi:hypothetical protein